MPATAADGPASATTVETSPAPGSEEPGRLAFPASSAQEQMWFLQQLAPDNPYYNVPLSLRLTGTLDRDALAAAVADLVDRHETLRTVFDDSGDELRQVVLDRADVPLTMTALPGEDAPEHDEALRAALDALARRPFDLTAEPPVRAGLLRLAEDEHILVLCVHHIVVDGWALGILVRELGVAYAARCVGRAPELPELSIQYADWSEWQRERQDTEDARAGLAYWRERLSGELPVLDLPADRPRPARPSYAGAQWELQLPAPLTSALRAFCRERGVTLYTALLAGYAAFLSRHTGGDDIIVGTPFANRDEPQVQPVVGYFANVLPMRLSLTGAPSFTELVARAGETVLGGRAHDRTRLEQIVAEVAPERTGDRATLVQAVFALQDFALPEPELAGLKAAHFLVDAQSTRHDLEFHVQDDGGALRVLVVYGTDLFDEPTVRRMAQRWVRLLQAAVAAPLTPVTALDLLTEEEHTALAVELARQGRPAEAVEETEPVALPERFARVVAERPGDVAVATGADELTWRELDGRAARLTARLAAAGTGPGSRLAVAAGADASGVTALLAALRTGAAVVVLDPADPPERNRDLVRRGGAHAVLTDAEGAWGVPRVPLGDTAPDAEDVPAASGGDGGPVLLEWSDHGLLGVGSPALAAQTALLADAAGLRPDDRVAVAAPPGSPAFVRGVLAALASGARLLLGGNDERGGQDEQGGRMASPTVVLAADRPPSRPGARTVLLAPPAPGPRGAADRVALAPGVGPYALAPEGRADFGPLLPVCVLDGEGPHAPWGVPGGVWAAPRGGTVAGLPERKDPFGAGLLLQPVGHTGRIDPGGRLTADGGGSEGAVLGGQWVDPACVERALLALDAVRDCRVTFRRRPVSAGQGLDGALEAVAFVVPSAAVDRERLTAAARTALPAGAPPARVVAVSVLPRTADGGVDVAVLDRLPVVDEELAAAWERHLTAEADGGPAIVLVTDDPPPEPDRLHLGTRDLGPRGSGHGTEQAGTDRESARSSEPAKADAPPSVSTGPELHPLPVADLAAALRRTAAGDGGMTHLRADGPQEQQSYAALAEDASRVLGGLRRLGARPGDPVLLQLPDTRDFVTGFWACVIGGFAAVPLASPPGGYGVDSAQAARLADAWDTLGEPWILAPSTARAGITGLLARQGRGTPRVACVDELLTGGQDQDWYRPSPDSLVLLLLTSGSTGRPKAVEQRHRNILTQVAAVHQRHGIGPADRSYNWMPLDHVGGLLMTHVRDLVAGASQVIAPTSWVLEDPLRWLDGIDRYRATTTWAPNFAYGLVGERLAEEPGRGWDLSCLRFAINGGEAVIARVVRRFLAALAPYGLSGTAVHPAWGMSETCSLEADSVLTLENSTDDDTFVSCGRPLPGFSVRVAGEDGLPVPEGAVGRLQVHGAAVTYGYHREPAKNAESFTADGWFETGDLAFLRDGELYLAGRAKDTIIVNGVNLQSHDIEAVAEDVPGVERSYTAAVAARAPGDTTDRLALFCCPQPGADERRLAVEITGRVTRETGVSPSFLVFTEPAAIPKTEIGKIQRSALQQRLAAGEFDAALRRTDLLLGNERTIVNRFHRPVWQRAEAPRTPLAAVDRAHTVVLADPGGAVADAFFGLVRAAGGRCTVLGPGATGDEALDRADRVLDLRLLGAPAREPEPLAALTALLRAQSAVREATGRALVLDVVATSSRAGLAGRGPVVPGRAAAVPVLKSGVQEWPWLTGRWIDVDTAGGPERLAALLWAESRSPVTDGDIAYRDGVRYVQRLEQLPAPGYASPLREGGHYLLTGGLGGLGVDTARHLLTAYGAAVTLVGRGDPGRDPGRAAALEELRALGDVRYAVADVTDRAAVHRVLREAAGCHGGALDGVFHLAGVLEERPLGEADADHWERVLAAKATGTEHLLEALGDRPDALFVAYSSVNGHFGGAGAAAYAAANAQLDALVAGRRDAGMPAVSLAWSMWDERGMSRGYALKPLTRARGYLPLGPREAVRSLDVALRHDEPHLLIGLDGGAPWVGSHLTGPAHPLHRLTAYLVPAPGTGRQGADRPGPADVFGTPASCARVHHETLPLTADGDVDRERLRRAGTGGVTAPGGATRGGEPPRDGTERALADLWCSVLDVDRVGRHDNFFDLGGRSLLATRLVSRIRTVLGHSVGVAALFEHPTVAGLAAHLEGRSTGASPFAPHLPLRPEGSATPLFCFHPGGGICWPFAPLLAHLDGAVPVHGVQSPGLTDPAALPGSIEEMADDYTRRIRELRPSGPYALLGWSLGGFVAHAVAERLQRAGERVELLAVLDSFPLRQEDLGSLPAPEELEGILLGLLLDGAGVAPAPGAAPPDRAAAVAALRSSGSALAGIDEAQLGRMVDVMRHNTGLVAGHTPGTVDGDLLVFTARRSHAADAPPPAERWRPHMTGEVTDHVLDSLHQEILRPAHLPFLAAPLNARLAPGAPGDGSHPTREGRSS
ncbi:SDR family NAD(P)-dependent oxidoreductase [Streptomyces coffeae]|uniref:SDR family NAD(P)-dependent oxidoreductase n=1 Tax=Streptomyces coffeae TaxID=621382 RepID=A0ABS1NEQ6_9ACTN|nr:SDR family NAD(P)-dependent oxidoreductase [Streptomyces coffeae]MBL1098513.1 SDR family NAD(P)-dependent oxidoreductase [Streptomyces coffeae]